VLRAPGGGSEGIAARRSKRRQILDRHVLQHPHLPAGSDTRGRTSSDASPGPGTRGPAAPSEERGEDVSGYVASHPRSRSSPSPEPAMDRHVGGSAVSAVGPGARPRRPHREPHHTSHGDSKYQEDDQADHRHSVWRPCRGVVSDSPCCVPNGTVEHTAAPAAAPNTPGGVRTGRPAADATAPGGRESGARSAD
jgi:hypothetical protein